MNDIEIGKRDTIMELRLEHLNKIKDMTEQHALRDSCNEYAEWYANFMAIGDRVQELTQRPISVHPAVYQQLEYDMKTNFDEVRKFWQNPQRKNGPKKYHMKQEPVQTAPVPKGGPNDKLRYS